MSKSTIPAAPVKTPPAPPAPPVSGVAAAPAPAAATVATQGFQIETFKAPPPVTRSSTGSASAFPFAATTVPSGDDFSGFTIPVAPGDGFDAEVKKITNRVMSALRRYKASNAGQNFSVRKIPNVGVRVWRLADGTKA